ncbi:glycerol-3-phosphate 1-O-acyltransferase PlsY [Legionella sp. W05-934-2]|uniref:glycerol-3-phosphate 1-O-acyltransferase PlsY n=1 Tax=Legionella sp. W05-934-2 TaxID=1198649 RepID=UPI00346191D7
MSHSFISAIVIIIGYLFGSICSAVIVSRAFHLPDPRSEGSKNPGATNVLRLSGKKYASMVMAADVLKGTIPVLFAKLMPVSELVITYTCLAAVLGHMFPIFFGFRGGKGVATAIGGLLGLQFILGVMVIAVWIIVANFTRYASLASILSMTAMPLLALWTTENVALFMPLFFITMFIYYKHRDNITRLMDGEESKLSIGKIFPSKLAEQPIATADIKTSVKTSKQATRKTSKKASASPVKQSKSKDASPKTTKTTKATKATKVTKVTKDDKK